MTTLDYKRYCCVENNDDCAERCNNNSCGKLENCYGGREFIECKFGIPVNIKPYHTSNLKIIEKKCPSFKRINNYNGGESSLESLSFFVKSRTDVLTLSINIDKSLKHHYVMRGKEADVDGEHEAFKVCDGSNQRMDYYETILDNRKQVPIYRHNNKELQWTIYNPKVGYTYILYFTINETVNKYKCKEI